jgi:ribonuclease BN (tRNA processing enzyme)
MKLRFWGTRGGIARPGPTTAELGGNTTCLQLDLGQDDPLLIDCGTGITEYGELGADLSRHSHFHILITHFHWDHVLGFPFFLPIHSPEVTIHLHAPFAKELILEHMGALFDGTYSPLLDMKNLPATIEIHEMGTEGAEIAGVRVTACPTDHTDPCFAYRFEQDGKTLCLAMDHESRPNDTNAQLADFFAGADLLVHGAQYTEEEYVADFVGLGHSSIERALATGERVGAARLLLTHHHPLHSDDRLRIHLARVLRRQPRPMPVDLAREGRDYEVGGRSDPALGAT